jgi:type III pantothenate kinase
VCSRRIGSQRGPVCVIGAGTAVTFDAVDAHGLHLGGLIFAGARLAAAALDAQTSNIGATAAAGARPAGLELLGKSTDAAVGNGAMLALAAALDSAVTAVDAALGARSMVYPHGRRWAAIARLAGNRDRTGADLVLEGLARSRRVPRTRRAQVGSRLMRNP